MNDHTISTIINNSIRVNLTDTRVLYHSYSVTVFILPVKNPNTISISPLRNCGVNIMIVTINAPTAAMTVLLIAPALSYLANRYATKRRRQTPGNNFNHTAKPNDNPASN